MGYMYHITLYADEFDGDAWAEYCEICGVPESAQEITIPFDIRKVKYQDVEQGNDTEDEDE